MDKQESFYWNFYSKVAQLIINARVSPSLASAKESSGSVRRPCDVCATVLTACVAS